MLVTPGKRLHILTDRIAYRSLIAWNRRESPSNRPPITSQSPQNHRVSLMQQAAEAPSSVRVCTRRKIGQSLTHARADSGAALFVQTKAVVFTHAGPCVRAWVNSSLLMAVLRGRLRVRLPQSSLLV